MNQYLKRAKDGLLMTTVAWVSAHIFNIVLFALVGGCAPLRDVRSSGVESMTATPAPDPALPALELRWTNPSTNTDGTPCEDLSRVVFYYSNETGTTWIHHFPLWWYDVEGDSLVWRSREGQPDSAAVALPPGPHVWRVHVEAWDWSGNRSDPSNEVTIDYSH